jgi:hypothetical protein
MGNERKRLRIGEAQPSRSFLSSLRRALVALSVLGATACASVQSQYTAIPLDVGGQLTGFRQTSSGLVISGEELGLYSSEHFGLIELTFENPSSQWLHIDRLALDFGSSARNDGVFLPRGADLEAWHAATVQRNEIRGSNEATALGVLLALGSVVAVAAHAGGGDELSAVGGALALGAASSAVASEQAARVDAAEQVPILPQAHLLATPFAVPPGLFTKKWVLLNTRSHETPCIVSMRIDYEVEHGPERVLLVFRRRDGSSEWQRRECTRAYRGSDRPPTGSGPKMDLMRGR